MSEEQTKKRPTSRPSVRPAKRAKKKAERQASAGESISTRLKKRSEQRAEKRAEKQADKKAAKQGAEKGVAKTAGKGSKAAAGKGAAVLGFFKPSQDDAAPKGAAGLVRFFRAPVIVCAAVLVALALLYGPARDLYCAWRENGALQEQDVKTLSEKEQIQEDISDLTSRDGIKDQARELGYVEDGETRIIVEGGEEPEEPDVVTSHDDDEGEDHGYLGFFDFFFGYEGEQ